MLIRQPGSRLIILGIVWSLMTVLAGSGSVVTGQTTPGTRNSAIAKAPLEEVVDREKGEADIIKQRQEWFYSTRKAGAEGRRLQLLRAEAMRFTRERIDAEDARAESAGETFDGNVWTCRGPSSSNFGGWNFGRVSGRLIALAKDWTNNVLYAGGASGGLWKSTNDGASWTSLFDAVGSQSVDVITIDPNNPNVLWAGTGENTTWCEDYFGIGLLRSTNGGLTWQARNGSLGATLENISAFAGVIVDPRDSNHLVVGGRYRDCVNGNYYYGGIYTTNDAGGTWTARLSGGVTDLAQDPVNRDVFWAALEDQGVFKSSDNGITWIPQTASSLPTGYVGKTALAISPANSQYVFVLFESAGGTPKFWRTINGGTSWSLMSSGSSACDGQCFYNMVLAAHPTDVNILYRGTIHVFKTTTGGSSWTDLSNPWGSSQKVHQDTHALLINPANPNQLYVGCDGGIWRTDNGGSSFVNLNSNLNMTQFYAIGNHPTNDDIIVGGSQDNSSLARTNSDLWDVQEVTGDGFVCHINPVNPNYVYLAGYPYDHYLGTVPSVYRSTSGVFGSFSHITNVYNGITANDRINWVTPYVLDPTNPAVLFLGTHRVYRSTNYGSAWNQVGPTDLTGGGGETILSLEVNPLNGQYVFAGTTDGRIWRSINGGTDWTNISTGLPSRAINDIAGDPGNAARAFCVVGGFGTAHLYEHTGSGNWVARGGGLPNVPANTVVMISSNEIYVGVDTGVFRSGDGGLSFSPFMNGMPQGVVVTDLKFATATQTLTAGTYGRGAWQFTILPQVVPVMGKRIAGIMILLAGLSLAVWAGRRQQRTPAAGN